MRLATKLTLLLLLPVAVVMAAFGYLRAQQERQRLIGEFQEELVGLGQTVRRAVEHSLRDRQPQDIRELLDQMVQEPNRLERIRVLNARLEPVAAAETGAAAPEVPQPELERVLNGGPPLVRYLDLPTGPLAYVLVPLRGRQNRPLGVLEIVQPATRVQRELAAATRDQMVRLSLLSLTLALVIWFTVRTTIRHPIGQLVAAALAFGDGNLAARAGLRRRDEIGRLAAAFNRMAERLQTAREREAAQGQARLDLERQVQHAEKLAAVGRLASEVAHEVGTPLNVISGRAAMIQQALPPDHPAGRHVETIFGQVDRITGILRQLLDYARPREPDLRPVALRPLVLQTVDLLEPLAHRRAVRLTADVPAETPPLLADADQLQQVLINLTMNAVDATPAAGEVRLFVGEPAPPPAGAAAIRHGAPRLPALTLGVEDTGAGIARERLERIFEPFFSTKPRLTGTGLGLPIVEEIVRAHQAGIEVRSAEGRGTAVILRWPLAAQPAGAGGLVEAAPAPGQP